MKTIQTDVVVIGAGLTGLTLAYYLHKAGIGVVLLEKHKMTGGVIQTQTENGFTFEAGPNTGVISSYELVQLFEDLDIEAEVPGKASKSRLIWKKGRWHALPSGLISAIGTPLFTFADKLRILGEPFREKACEKYETIASLVRRRLGKSFLTYAIDPFISGIYAGDPESLVTSFALPKLYALENNYGSFIKGSIHKMKEPKSQEDKKVTKEVFSVRGGLRQLTEALTRHIGEENIMTEASETQVMPDQGQYVTSFFKNGERISITSSRVVSTVNGHALPDLFPFVDHEMMRHISDIRYAKVIQVVAGYKIWKGLKVKAFGGLVPSVENKDVLGILFPSALFTNRAPEGGALFSIFMGGIKRPDLFLKSDDEIRDIALQHMKSMMLSKEDPDMLKIFRYEKAIPQYEASSGKRFHTIREVEATYPGLILAGNIRDGIGMPDRVKQAKKTADQLIDEINGKQP